MQKLMRMLYWILCRLIRRLQDSKRVRKNMYTLSSVENLPTLNSPPFVYLAVSSEVLLSREVIEWLVFSIDYIF